MSKFAKFSDYIENKKTEKGLAAGVETIKKDDREALDYGEKPDPELTGFVYKADDDDAEGLGNKKGGADVSDSALGEKPDSKVKKPTKKKLTAEEFVHKTWEMSDAEFLKFMTESADASVTTITDLYGNEFTPDPNQTIAYLSGLLLASESLMSRFVREVKRRGGIEELVSEVFSHPESYEVAVESMRHPEGGVDMCEQFARAMNEQYMTDMSKYVEVNEDVLPNMDRREGWGKTQPTGGQPNTPTGGPDTTNTQNPNMQSKGNPAGGGGSNPGPMTPYDTRDTTYSQPDEYSQGGEPRGHDIRGSGGQQQPPGQQPDFGQGPVKQKKMMKEFGGDFAFKNLGESMIKYDDIRNYLEGRCAHCKKKH